MVWAPRMMKPTVSDFVQDAHSKQWPDIYQAVLRQFIDLIAKMTPGATAFHVAPFVNGCEIHFASKNYAVYLLPSVSLKTSQTAFKAMFYTNY